MEKQFSGDQREDFNRGIMSMENVFIILVGWLPSVEAQILLLINQDIHL